MNYDDLSNQVTGGYAKIIPLRELTLNDLMMMYNNPFTDCSACGGTGVQAGIVPYAPGIFVLAARECPYCDGGFILTMCAN